MTGDYYIPEKVISISDFAFYNCNKLNSIHLSANTWGFGLGAFLNCMCNVIAEKDNKYYINVDNLLFSSDMKYIHYCSPAISGSYSIPSGVDEIESYAFANCTKLHQIIIPEFVKLESSVFFNCTGLQQIHSLDPDPHSVYYGDGEDVKRDLFYNLDKTKCTLFVPEKSKIYYENVQQWKDFYNIKEYSLSVENDTIKIENMAQNNISLRVNASYLWSISISCDWLKADINAGEGNETVEFMALENTDTIARSAVIKLSGFGVDTVSVTVIQDKYINPMSVSTISEVSPIKYDKEEGILSFSNNFSSGKVLICDVIGRVKYNRVLKGKSEIIDISNLPGGVYFVNLQTSEKTFKRRIIRSIQ